MNFALTFNEKIGAYCLPPQGKVEKSKLTVFCLDPKERKKLGLPRPDIKAPTIGVILLQKQGRYMIPKDYLEPLAKTGANLLFLTGGKRLPYEIEARCHGLVVLDNSRWEIRLGTRRNIPVLCLGEAINALASVLEVELEYREEDEREPREVFLSTKLKKALRTKGTFIAQAQSEGKFVLTKGTLPELTVMGLGHDRTVYVFGQGIRDRVLGMNLAPGELADAVFNLFYRWAKHLRDDLPL